MATGQIYIVQENGFTMIVTVGCDGTKAKEVIRHMPQSDCFQVEIQDNEGSPAYMFEPTRQATPDLDPESVFKHIAGQFGELQFTDIHQVHMDGSETTHKPGSVVWDIAMPLFERLIDWIQN